jgi:membrane associated rhomboid family serine protease
MIQVSVSSFPNTPQLDICKTCKFIWFDPQEYEAVPSLPQPEEELSPEVRKEIALAQVQLLAEQRAEQRAEEDEPDEWWQVIPALLALPVEEESAELQHAPWLTWGLAAAIGMVSIIAFTHFPNAINQVGLIPAVPLRYGGLTFLTSFFLQGGWIHLVINTYCLLMFGDNVEDYLRERRYLVLLASAAIAGSLLHVLFAPDRQMPCLGASAAISGIIVFYALQFPHARLGLFTRWYVVPGFAHMPAYMALGFWLAAQIIGDWQQIPGFTNASAFVFLGGASAGFFFWLMWRKT